MGTTYFFPPGQNNMVESQQKQPEQQDDRVQIGPLHGFVYHAPPPNVGRFKPKTATIQAYWTAPELRYVGFWCCFFIQTISRIF